MKKYALFLMVALGLQAALAQTQNQAYKQYIKQYAPLAVSEMKTYGIPASITLAQGLLESAAGTSNLARKSNNHFGIKCGTDWTGSTVTHTDDRPNECFRAYSKVEDSYRDHSLFLRNRPRYSSLFTLSPTDYRGWAKGLQQAGYATAQTYAGSLINIIEDYQLMVYDRTKDGFQHSLQAANGLMYIIVQAGDTWKSLSKEFHLTKRQLRRYNDLYKGYELQEGDIIYLEEKRKAATGTYIHHIVQPGDSMYSISQQYGIRLKNLYQLNGMEQDALVPPVGEWVWLQ